MNLIWHIVRKDLRQVRFHLLLLGATGIVIYVVSLRILPPEKTQSIWGDERGLYFTIYFALWVTLIPAMLQADAPTGTSEFWMTRPISPAAVFTAKIIEGLLALVLVLGGHWIFLYTQGFYPAQIMSATASLVFNLAGLGAFAFFLASVTRGIGQFWFVLVALFFGSVIWSMAWQFSENSAEVNMAPAGSTPLFPFVLVGIVVLVGFQYRHRRRSISWGAAAGLVVVAALLPRFLTSRENHSTTSDQTISWNVQPLTESAGADNFARAFPSLGVRVLPPVGSAAHFNLVFGDTTWSDGRILTAEEADNNSNSNIYFGRIAAAEAVLDPGYVLNEASGPEELPINIPLAPAGDFIAGGEVRPTRYDGELDVEQVHYVMLGKTILKTGATLSRDGSKLVVLAAPLENRLRRLVVKYQSPAYNGVGSSELRMPLLILINPGRREARVLSAGGYSDRKETGIPGLSLVAIAWDFLGLEGGKESRSAIDDAWLKDALLVVFSENIESTITQTIACALEKEGDRLTWKPTSPGEHKRRDFSRSRVIYSTETMELTTKP